MPSLLEIWVNHPRFYRIKEEENYIEVFLLATKVGNKWVAIDPITDMPKIYPDEVYSVCILKDKLFTQPEKT